MNKAAVGMMIAGAVLIGIGLVMSAKAPGTAATTPAGGTDPGTGSQPGAATA